MWLTIRRLSWDAKHRAFTRFALLFHSGDEIESKALLNGSQFVGSIAGAFNLNQGKKDAELLI